MTRVERWSEDAVLRYDAATARHLELFSPQAGGEAAHTLWHHLNLAVTAGGARRLRAWLERPLATRAAVLARQEASLPGSRRAPRGSFRESLRGLPDLERLAARIACAKASPRDLGALRDALARLPAWRRGFRSRAGRVRRHPSARSMFPRDGPPVCARRSSTNRP
jgi:DNA mismatch repair protein MutS